VVVGLPGQIWWTRGAARPRRELLTWAGRFVAGRLRGRPVLWVPVDLDRPQRTQGLERVGDTLVRLLARRVPPGRVAAELGP
jgi:hypothetical protein